MRLRYIITLLLTGSLLSGTALLFLFFNVAPTNHIFVPGLFTLLVFFCILGIISTVLISSRSRGENAWRAQVNLATSIRQGVVIGILVCISLWLAHMRILSLWILIVLIFIAAFIEYRLLPLSLREKTS